MSAHQVMLLALADGSIACPTDDLSSLGGADPFGLIRYVAYEGVDGVAAGVLNGSGDFEINSFPYIEMLIVHSGCITVKSEEQVFEVSLGESLVIGYGTRCTVSMAPGTVAAFCAVTLLDGEEAAGLFWIERYADLEPSATLAPPILIGRAPQCRALSTFQGSASSMKVGVWDSTPYQRYARPHRIHELMNLIEGQVTLTMEDGRVVEVGAGDTVFVPQGAPCAWLSTGYVRKYYAVV